MRYAVIYNNIVINVIEWDGKEKITYPFKHDDIIPDRDYGIGQNITKPKKALHINNNDNTKKLTLIQRIISYIKRLWKR
jgi:hypothetical protein